MFPVFSALSVHSNNENVCLYAWKIPIGSFSHHSYVSSDFEELHRRRVAINAKSCLRFMDYLPIFLSCFYKGPPRLYANSTSWILIISTRLHRLRLVWRQNDVYLEMLGNGPRWSVGVRLSECCRVDRCEKCVAFTDAIVLRKITRANNVYWPESLNLSSSSSLSCCRYERDRVKTHFCCENVH